VGATGSKIVMSLAKLGVKHINVWDDDIVAEHNVANQIYGNCHVGMKKSEALYSIVKEYTGTEIKINDCKVGEEPVNFSGVVFLLTDTMKSRKEVFESSLKFKLSVRWVIETRMGTDVFRVYAFNPSSVTHIEAWENTLYDDSEAEVSACGSTFSVGPTADAVSAAAVWNFIRWNALYNHNEDNNDDVENELIVGLRPYSCLCNKF
jgi:molybdopterin/thiamine biosynthesis adenylyltransferase